MINNLYKSIRLLAKSNQYQTLFSYFKEGCNVKIFNNDIDLTDIQLLFLNYLSFYHNLYIDVALGEVTDVIFKDIIYEDAYSYWKNKKDKKVDYNINKYQDNNRKKADDVWIFKSTKRKK